MLKKLLLIIEDNPFLTDMYRQAFERAGVQVHLAHNGKDGLQLVKIENPDLILLDILMPDMTGLDVLRKIKEEKIKHGRIIVLTVLADDFTKKEIKRLGATDYLLKSDLELRDIVERVVVYLK